VSENDGQHRTMNARAAMLSRLRRRKHETALEREFYCSTEEYQVDLDMIWYRDWLFVGHDCEVSNPGDYLTVQIGEYPVVVVRDRSGGLNAFHNSCRHRGSRICSAERGSVTRLVCPYHQWTYHLDGRRVGAPDKGVGLENAQ
jgi:Rieske 2Fe-2S family protein